MEEIQKVPADPPKSDERYIKLVQETHTYARLTMQLLVGWFTFFVTVNFATIGWLAKDASSSSGVNVVLALVSTLFVFQNVFGVLICNFVREYFRKTDSRVQEIHDEWGPSKGFRDDSLPLDLFTKSAALMTATLITIMAFWVGFALYFLWRPR